MDYFEKFDSNTPLHHAYILSGESEGILSALFKLFDRIGIARVGNPDFTLSRHSIFSIDDSRLLKQGDIEKSISNTKKIFIIVAEDFTREAQQALLKVLEDPKEGTHFFIIVPRSEIFLPTILSRVHLIEGKNPEEINTKEALHFLESTEAKRLSYIAKLINRHKDNEDSGELKKEARDLVNGLESILAESLQEESVAQKLKELNKTKSYIGDRGASVKMILEHLALIL